MHHQPEGTLLTVTTTQDICDHSDLPRWLCVHCPEWGTTHASLPPVAPDKPRTITGYWTISYDGRAGHKRQWTGFSVNQKNGNLEPTIITNCPHPSDAVLCNDCVEDLVAVLADVPALLHDLDVAIIRDTTFVEHGTTSHPYPTQSEPKPWNERASKAKDRLVETLKTAAETTGVVQPSKVTFRAVVYASRLTQHIHQIARRDDVLDIANAITRAVATARRTTDRPDPLIYYGLCPDCGEEIRSARVSKHDKDARITCANPECEYSAKYADHLITQLDLGADRMLTEDELVGAIARVDEEPVTRAQIKKWIATEGVVHDKRVAETQWVGDQIVTTEVDTYRLGDIRALADGENLDAHKGTVTSRELAAACGMSEAALWKAVERGSVEPVRKGARPLRFREDEAERFKTARKAS